jgi:RNA polymerase sigma-70 factor (ECF subfamily)
LKLSFSITERAGAGHPRRVPSEIAAALPSSGPASEIRAVTGAPLDFEALYDAHVVFVFRNVRRLGVPDAHVDDAVQEVFLVVHRRLAEFEGRSSVRTWLFGILARVAADHRRSLRRKSPHLRSPGGVVEPDSIAVERDGPHDVATRAEGVRLLHALLGELDDDKRAVLILAELEQMSSPEIAESLGVNLNTVYARLRAARREFEQAAQRERARDTWRLT